MRVKVMTAFRSRGELMKVGTVLTVEARYFHRLAHLVDPLTLKDTEEGYLHLLECWWGPTTENLPPEKIHQLLARLDELYRILHRAGRRAPVRLPVERNRNQEQQPGLAL